MRILHLVRTLTVGGIEPHLMTLGRGLQAVGCEVAIASDGGNGSHSHGIDWFTSHGFRHYLVAFPGPDMNAAILRRAVQSALNFRSAVEDFRPDLIHVHYRATSVYAQIAQLAAGIPFVSTLHIIPIPSGSLYRSVSFWGEHTIAISSEVRKYLKSAFEVKESRIRLIHHGVDTDPYRPPTRGERQAARDKFDVTSAPLVIAMLARMSWEKGHDLLLKALACLREQGYRPVALLAGVSISGETQWRDAMVKMASQLGCADQVRFLGYADARDVLWSSDISVLPSRWEGFGLAVVEAMLCGLVPVRTPAAGASDQIDDGENGFIVPFESSESLAQRLKVLIQEEGLRHQMALAARAKALSKFSATGMVTKTLNVYEDVLNCRKATA
ncbi:MAG: glycosyltransferase family 4 protein [Bryobacteraceae bacterium]